MSRLPDQCRSMPELREEIDRIDRELVALFARRAACIDRAVVLKRAEGLPARIDARVDEVLQRVAASAQAQDWDSALAEDLWRRVIDWSIAREERALEGEDRNRDG